MVSEHLIGVALQQLVAGAASVAKFSAAVGDPGGRTAAAALAPALSFLQARFTDQSSRLTAAIEAATDRAWRALELVLAGDSLWDRLQGAVAAGDMKAFRHDVRGLLAAANVDGNYPVDRRAAARELRAARKAGHLQPTGLTPAGMAESVGVFARFDDPADLAAAQWRAAAAVAVDLTAEGYPALAAVVGFRPGGSALPVLGVAVRYFFRRAVERDAELARGLTFARLEGLAEAQQNQFASLDRLVTEQADRLDAALGELAAGVAEVKAVALDIRAEQDRLGDQNRQIMEAILALQGKLDQTGRPAVRPHDSLSVRTDGERELVKKVIAQYRRLPESERADRPALQNAVGMLEVAAGEFAAAQSDFAAVAQSVDDPVAKGAAHLNAYRAALESRDWTSALKELVSAVRCDGRRFAPFPVGKYVPQRILGAGGFGVAFLCKHKYMDAHVVVKTLSGAGPDQDFEAVFTEARAAAGIQHPGIVRVTDCGYAEAATKDRPFVVMDYFPGQALDEHVRANGPVAVKGLIPLARSLAEALGAAHAKGILHRDVKPGNVLVRRSGDAFEVRVIDFGLAVRHRAGPDVSTSRASKTLAGESIAGTVDYAAPEQMGRGNGAKVGPYSDVYGWAKSCCFALFQTPQPTLRHWQGLPPGLADLLGRCLEEDPKARPASFARVLAELDQLDSTAKPTATTRSPTLDAAWGDRDREDDDPPARKRRRERDEDSERPRPSRKKPRAAGGLPAWAGGAIALGVIVLIAAAAVLTGRGKQPDPPVAGVQGPDSVPKGPKAVTGGKEPITPTPKGANVVPPGKEPYIFGSIEHDPKFKTVGPEGATLVGLDVRFAKFGATDIARAVRPIYRVSGREEAGKSFGTNFAGAVTMRARAGYAVGGMTGKAGWWCNGFSLTYMRVKGDGTLDPKDSYEGEWAGFNGEGDVSKVLSDGAPVVGIVGKIVGTETTALGLLFKGQDGSGPEGRPKDTPPNPTPDPTPAASVFQERQRYPLRNLGAESAQFDLEGRSVVFTGADRRVVVMDVKSGGTREVMTPGKSNGPLLVAILNDGKVGAACFGDKELLVTDKNGNAAARITLPVLPPATGNEEPDVVFQASPNGRYAALSRRGKWLNAVTSAERFTTPLRVRDTSTGKDVLSTEWQSGSVLFNADSSRVLVVDNFGRGQWFKLPSGEADGEWKFGPVGRPLYVLFASRDARVLVCNGFNGDSATRVLVDGHTGTSIAVLADRGLQNSYQLSADGKLVVSLARGSDWFLNLFDGARGTGIGQMKLPATNDGSGSVVAFAPDGRTAVVVDRKQSATAIVYDVVATAGAVTPRNP
ncbi:protein kinase domain-containing protein [Gemmata sp.]|uniref:protein kinase domain-containing protein n=1 Tax=Gemmata sp. TaxID=1914242 RepID=UPI003F70D6F4